MPCSIERKSKTKKKQKQREKKVEERVSNNKTNNIRIEFFFSFAYRYILNCYKYGTIQKCTITYFLSILADRSRKIHSMKE